MNKQNLNSVKKCEYCRNEAKGIIYRAKQNLNNVYSCNNHATNLFIPFKLPSAQLSNKNKTSLKQSQYHEQQTYKSPQIFFNKLMSNLIQQFNEMKQQIIGNYQKMIELQPNQQALNFKMDGDQANPYMIINNDQQMMMNSFVNRLLARHTQQTNRLRQQQIAKRRQQLSKIMANSKQDSKFQSRLLHLKQLNTTMMVRSQECSPQNLKSSRNSSINTTLFWDYSRTQKRTKNS